MGSSTYTPQAQVVAERKLEEMTNHYGPCEVYDASAYVMGLTDHIPATCSCGCKIGRFIRTRLGRARLEYAERVASGKHLFALLGGFSAGRDGPLSVVRLNDGTVIVILSPSVAQTNPVMTIKDGTVSISGRESVRDSILKPGISSNPIVRAAEDALERRSNMQLVEPVAGGTTVTVNSIHSNDFYVVHPQSACKKWKGHVGSDSEVTKESRGSAPEQRRRERTVDYAAETDVDSGHRSRRRHHRRKNTRGECRY